MSSCCERPSDSDAGDPALEEVRELPAELRLQVVVLVARVLVELPLRKGRRGHARDRIRGDEQRVLEQHRVDVVPEKRPGGLHVEAGQRVGELEPCQHVLRVVVDRFRDLDVAATAATAKDGAKGAAALTTLPGIAGKGFPVRRKREVEACPALLPGELEIGGRRGRDRQEHVRLGRIRVGGASRAKVLQRERGAVDSVPQRPVGRREDMGRFAEPAAHSPRVVSAHIHDVELVGPAHATARRVEVKGAFRLLEHQREVVQIRAAVEVLVFAELGGVLVAADAEAAELHRHPVEQAA